jgi:hypothetical protein
MVGVEDVSDSVLALDSVSCLGDGAWSATIFGGGVGGAGNYISETCEGNTLFGRKLELISPIPIKKSNGMTFTRFACQAHTSPLSSITATID